jgi:glycosyltransferase involved in cell wall biosynthesis
MSGPRLRTLILAAKATEADAAERARRGEAPRVEYLELARAINAEVIDLNDVGRSTDRSVCLARRLGLFWGLAALAMQRRRDFDQFYVTGEDIGIPFGAMMRAARDAGRITLVAHQAGTAKRRTVLRAVGPSLWRNVIVFTSSQREILCDGIGYPQNTVLRLDLHTDAQFFRPAEAGTGAYVFSCGLEGRDYATLQRAAELLPHQFCIVASGWTSRVGFAKSDAAVIASQNVVVRSGLSYEELRDAYAQARMVVLPLFPADYGAGLTALCEAMAMGKAVVASDSPGIRDYVRHGFSGLLVPCGNPVALSHAIAELWDDPERCAKMGEYNRAWVETSMSTERFVMRVADLLGAAITADRTP